jgi:hypothetical protein
LVYRPLDAPLSSVVKCPMVNKLDSEVWKPVTVDGLRNSYRVSSHGRVMRVARGSGTQHGRVLRGSPNAVGYPVANLSLDGEPKQYLVHRLVATAFLGPPPPKHEVNHIDGVTTNNRADNLEWVTKSENGKHAFRIGLHVHHGLRGEQIGTAKVNETQVREIRAKHLAGATTRELSAEYGIQMQTIWKIVTRRAWRHVN